MITIEELPEADGDLTDDAELHRMRSRFWAARSDRGVEILSFDQGLQVLEHPGFLKGPSFQYRLDQVGISGEARRYMDMGITNKEGEERRRMRASYAALFRQSQIARLRDGIRRTTHEILDEMEGERELDLMRLCWELPARTYCDLVSMPHEVSQEVIRIARSVLGVILSVDRSRREHAERVILESIELIREHLEQRRKHLGDDFTSVMIRQQQDGLMSEEELLAQSFAVLQASVDNTANQLGNTFGMLLSDRERWEALVADPSIRGAVVEEGIRLYPRFGTIFRLAAEDVVIDDLVIPEGTWAFVSTRAAHRDPAVFPEPDEYRLSRPLVRALQFGAGPYNCLGQHLARMEFEEALQAVAERYPDIRLTGPWERRTYDAVSETLRLPVALGTPVPRTIEPAASAAGAGSDERSPARAPIAGPDSAEASIQVRVTGMQLAAEDAMLLDLRRPDCGALPEWSAGAHIDLVLGEGVVRRYSLCGSPADRERYRVVVLREASGTGGSAFVHDRLRVGDRLEVRGPRNRFPLESAPRYRFIAAGIGITPIYAMAAEAGRRGADWSLVYVGRDRSRMALLEEVLALGADRVDIVETAREGRPGVERLVGAEDEGAQIYACGPTGLLDALAAGRAEGIVHVERFVPDRAAIEAPKAAFELRLARSGRCLEVAADASILETVEAAGIDWPYSCREGTCGTCEARILGGVADHRDAVLTPAERRQNEMMMICVSRARSGSLELDI